MPYTCSFDSIDLNIQNLKMDLLPSKVKEVEVIADPTTPTARNTVLMRNGRSADIISFSGWCTSAQYASLVTDKLNNSQSTLSIYLRNTNLYSGTCSINNINITAKNDSNYIWVDLEFISV